MKRYLLTRMLMGVVTLLGVSLIIFLILRVVPGDVAYMILVGTSGEGVATPERLAALRQELGLNDPLHVQYARWLWGFARLDLGDSLRSGFPVVEEIKQRLPLTFELATLTIIVASLIAIPLGILSAIRQNSWIDQVARVVSVAGLAMPTFWTGTILIILLVIYFRWSPPLGYTAPWEDPWKNVQQLVWPAFALGYYFSAVVSRMTRSCMLEVLRQDYIRTAWAKGLRERIVVVRHALKNAILPIITVIGIQYVVLLGGTVIMETLFFLPGIGSALVEAIHFRDYPMVQTIIVIFAFITFLANLVVDLLYAGLDPRVRLGQ